MGGFLGLGGLCGGFVGFLGGVQFGDLGVDDAVLDLAEQQDRLSKLMPDWQDIPTSQVVPSQHRPFDGLRDRVGRSSRRA